MGANLQGMMLLNKSSYLTPLLTLLFLTAQFLVPIESEAQVRIDSLKKVTFSRYSYPDWSPDGQQLVYESNATGSWEIYIMDRTGRNIRQLTDNGHSDRMPSWSPDGQYIAFISDSLRNMDLMRMDTDGSNRVHLGNENTHEIHPYWSPEGRQVIYNALVRERSVYEIRIMDRDGNNSDVILSDDDLNSYASISPDGQTIVFDKWYENNSENGEIFTIRTDGSNLKRITENSVYDGYPSWFPDSRTIIYSAEVDSIFKLFSITDQGTHKKQLTFGPYHERRANVSAKGDRLAFNREVDGSINIYSFVIDTQDRDDFRDVKLDSLQKLTNPEFAYPHWSADGTEIVYQSNVTGSSEIYRMKENGSDIVRLTRNSSGDIHPSWSPDGSKIAFVSDRDGDSEIFVMDRDGGNQQQITQNERRDIHPYWSHDGNQIMFNSSEDDDVLFVQSVELENRSVQTLLKDTLVNSYASYAPDGKKMVYVKWLDEGRNGEIFTMDLETGEEARLTDNSRFDGYPSWSPDGRKIVYASMVEGQFKLIAINVDGTGEQQLTRGEGSDARPNWSADGKRIMFNRTRRNSTDIYILYLGS